MTMLKKLRLAVAAACLLETACFVILWMRSLRQVDYITYRGSSFSKLQIGATEGRLLLIHESEESVDDDTLGFNLLSQSRESLRPPPGMKARSRDLVPWPRLYLDPGCVSIAIPFWLLTLLSGSLGAVVCVRRPFRFSLRTLAIAATAIVLTLGLGVAASRLTLG